MKKVDLNDYISNKGLSVYIFLDIDGVLNNENYILKCYRKHHKPMSMNHVPFDPRCLNNLMQLVQIIENHFEVKLVLSSTWRLSEIDCEIVNARLAEYGMRLSGKTTYMEGNRGLEIKDYLDNNLRYKCYNFIILDDDICDITPYFPNNIVHTNFKTGFTKRCLKQVLKILKIKKESLLWKIIKS